MAVNNKPIFGGIVESGVVNISTANTSTAQVNSPADAADFRLLFTAGANGGFIDEIQLQWIGTGTPSAGIFNIWITDTSNANARIYKMNTTTANTGAISTTVIGGQFVYTFTNFNVKAGQRVYVSQTVIAANTTLNVTLFGGQFAIDNA
jgi:hypothetical protein